MTYGLIFYEAEQEFARRDSAEAPTYWQAWSAYIDLLAEEGVLVRGAGAGLQQPLTATTVKVHDGKRLIQDGPMMDTKEQIGGFLLLEVASLDEAIRWAAQAPCAANGGVEVRPVLPPPNS